MTSLSNEYPTLSLAYHMTSLQTKWLHRPWLPYISLMVLLFSWLPHPSQFINPMNLVPACLLYPQFSQAILAFISRRPHYPSASGNIKSNYKLQENEFSYSNIYSSIQTISKQENCRNISKMKRLKSWYLINHRCNIMKKKLSNQGFQETSILYHPE